jgi:hypothetical protein
MSNHRIPNASSRNRAKANVEEIEKIVRSAGFSTPVVVVLLPDENQLSRALRERLLDSTEGYDFGQPQKLLKELFRGSGVHAVVDLMPEFQRPSLNPSCLFMNDSHWNPDGHRLVANHLAAFLAESGLLR